MFLIIIGWGHDKHVHKIREHGRRMFHKQSTWQVLLNKFRMDIEGELEENTYDLDTILEYERGREGER